MDVVAELFDDVKFCCPISSHICLTQHCHLGSNSRDACAPEAAGVLGSTGVT